MAGAGNCTVPPEVQGTYSYRDRDTGSTVTVGYICPGVMRTGWNYADWYAIYVADIQRHGQSALDVEVTAHAPWKLDVSTYTYYGVHLSADAYQVLYNDAATIAC